MGNRTEGSWHHVGEFTPTQLNAPAGSIRNAAIAADAAIDATKLIHQFQKHYAQANGSSVAAAVVPLHVVRGATGTLIELEAGLITPCVGDSTITVDLKKNGSSILSGTITLDSGDAARTMVAAAGFSSAAIVAGDFLEVVVTVSAGSGTLGQGLLVQLTHREAAE